MCPTYHMCCHIFGVFDFCEVTATKIRHRAVGTGVVGRGPICPPPHIFADHFTLSQLSTSSIFFLGGGQIMSATLILPPPWILGLSYVPDSA